MPDKEPLFSIITVCYNAEATHGRTQAGVDSQTLTDYEHLIIDGASSDDTPKLLDAHPSAKRSVRSERDKGIYDAMNKGISMATGRYLIFLNAGDKFHSADTLARIAEAIERENTPGIVYGQTDIVDDSGRRLGPRHLTAPEGLKLADFADGMVVCHQAFVALRKITGFYNLRYRFSADYEWCIRCLQHSRKNVGLTDTVLIDYLNEGVTTANHRASLFERFRIMSYYYGFFPTLFKHISFARRWRKRQKTAK